MNAQERAARAALRPRTGQVAVAPIEPPLRDWWTDHQTLAELWRWLEDRGQEPDDVAYFLERPWKWAPEHDEMRVAQAAA